MISAVKQEKTLSCFDLDRTLFSANSSRCFGIYLYQQKILSFPKLFYLFSCYSLHKLGVMNMHMLQNKIFSSFFKGKSKEAIGVHAKTFLLKNFDKLLYPPAVANFKKAKARGDYTVILSSSPDFLVSLIAQAFAVDEWAATEYATDESGCFSFIFHVMEGKDKADYVDRLSKRLDIKKENIAVYSDSHLDLQFLQAAGSPVAVNPDRRLRATSKKMNWEII